MADRSAADHATVHRYYLPSENGEGWAEVVITLGGFFSAVSDYGNYAFAWRGFGDRDFRAFLLGAQRDHDYFTKKLQHGGDGPGDVYDGPATLARIKGLILRYRREGTFDRGRAREEWDLLADHDVGWSESDFQAWYRETEISDAYDLASRKRNPRALAFVREVLARRLGPIFSAELAAQVSGNTGGEK